MDNIIKIGNDEQIINQIESTLSISQQDAESIFKYLQLSFQENTDVFGCIYTNAPEGKEMMAKGGQYNIIAFCGGERPLVRLPTAAVRSKNGRVNQPLFKGLITTV